MRIAGGSPRQRRWNCAALLLALACSSGCYGVSSSHYFAMADLNAPDRELTFYRITIKASSFLTTSQYNAGFYDANALHQLFGEVKSPTPPAPVEVPKKTDSGTTGSATKGRPVPTAVTPSAPPVATPTTTATTTNASSLQAGTVQLECDVKGNCRVNGGANDRFTVIYGANADAVADQIRAFADSDSTGKQIASLLAASVSADVFERTAAADQMTEQAKQNAAALAKDLKSLADQIAKAKSADEARKLLLRAAQLASQRAGASTVFDVTDLDKGFAQAQATLEALSK